MIHMFTPEKCYRLMCVSSSKKCHPFPGLEEAVVSGDLCQGAGKDGAWGSYQITVENSALDHSDRAQFKTLVADSS